VFRLLGFLVIFAITAGGYVFFDYRMSARWAGKSDTDGVTFSEYLSGIPARLSNLGSGAASAAGLPSKLAEMLPKPPEGWKVRPVDAKDTAGFLPKDSGKADKAGIAAVNAMVAGEAGSGVEVAALTYEKGDRKLIIKAVRYPNVIFTSDASLQQRIDLQSHGAQFRGTEFGTVRGLDVTEDLLPEGFRGRMFLADVGAQIQLQILAPKRMADTDLIPFLETLHVKAMNADVIDHVEGLGEVPVIVLASALADDARDAYLADVAARTAARMAKVSAAEAQIAAAEAAVPAEAPSGGGFLSGLFGSGDTSTKDTAPKEQAAKVDCSTGKDGVKRCTVTQAEPASN
jgi:hypothetical protein